MNKPYKISAVARWSSPWLKFWPVALVCAMLAMTSATRAQEEQEQSLVSVQGKRNFVGSILAGIQDSEYEIRWQDGAEAYQSPNRATDLRFSYLPTGFTAIRRDPHVDSDLWTAGIFLTGVDSEGSFEPDERAVLACQKKEAMIQHGSVSIHYVNGTNGMRQTFILDRKPASEQDQQGLVLYLTVQTDGVGLKVDKSNQSIGFENLTTGTRELQYDGLKAWDSTGRPLAAQFASVSDTEFAIAVDDASAVYPVTVDPLSTTPLVNQSQAQSGCQFGFSIAQVNSACGTAHLIVGAPYYDNGQTDEGMVFVYYDNCSPGFPYSSTADWSAESNQAHANLGWSVAALDADNDTYPDFAASAPFYSASGLTNNGAVFIWSNSSSGLGSAGTPANADWTAYGDKGNSEFGYSIARAPSLDNNGSGYDSLAVGAPYYDVGTNAYVGKAYVYYNNGLSGISSSAGWTALGSARYEFFGFSVADAGDVNNDSYNELMVGAPTADSTYGQAMIWYGSSSGLGGSPNRTLSDGQSGSQFGWAVSTAQDVNGDGYADVIVGAPSYSNGQSGEGRVSVYYGSSTGIGTSPDWTAENNQAGAKLGFSVSAVADFDADGYTSVMAGAPYYDFTNTDDGRAFVWDGSSSGLVSGGGTPSNADWAMSNIGTSHKTGYSVGYFQTRYYQGVMIGVPGANNATLFDYVP